MQGFHACLSYVKEPTSERISIQTTITFDTTNTNVVKRWAF